MILDVSTAAAVLVLSSLVGSGHAGSSAELAVNAAKRSANTPNDVAYARKRRHANLSKHARSKKRQLGSLFSATGFGTLYYDVNGGGTCGPVNGWYSYPETQGYTACEPWQNPKTIAQRGSNRIVAIPSNMLNGNQAKYCGKEVTVTWQGKTISGLIAWDGCASCNSDNGIDFSSTIFGELVSEKNCGMGKVQGVTWEILDKQIWDTNGNPVASSGNGGGEEPKPDPKPEPKPATTSTKVEPTTTSTSSSSKTTPKETTSSTPPPSSSTVEAAPSTTKTTSSKPAEKPVDNTPKTTSSEAAFTPTSLSEIFTSSSTLSLPSLTGLPAHNGAGKPNPLPSTSTSDAPKPSETVTAPAPPAGVPSVSPSAPDEVDPSYDESDLPACNDSAGQWRCDGNNGLAQCIQRLDGKGWIWFTRIHCGNKAPINCDSANPTCPSGSKRTCPVKSARRL